MSDEVSIPRPQDGWLAESPVAAAIYEVLVMADPLDRRRDPKYASMGMTCIEDCYAADASCVYYAHAEVNEDLRAITEIHSLDIMMDAFTELLGEERVRAASVKLMKCHTEIYAALQRGEEER